MRHQQRVAVLAGLVLAGCLAVPAVSAHTISGGTAVPSAPRAVQVHDGGRSPSTGSVLTDR